jgi:NAD(P)-dependent dehydrogenase (short-subunit alcohol dehydrogenase family)
MCGRFQDRAVIVMGAGTRGDGVGNGQACALAYAREGARVLCVDIDESAAAITAGAIGASGGHALPFRADINDEAACLATVQKCLEVFGRLDVLHNNVGVGTNSDLEGISRGDWDRTFDVNVGGVFQVCKHAIAVMKDAGKGVILNISSIAAIRPLPDPAYAASKGALNSLTMYLASRYGRYNIRTNALLLGYIDTPLARPAWENKKVRDINLRQVPLRRFASPQEVATAATFLASDDASYVNGAILPVDGGLCAANT